MRQRSKGGRQWQSARHDRVTIPALATASSAASVLNGTGSSDGRTDYPPRNIVFRVAVLAAVLGSEAILASLFLDGATLAHKDGVLTGFLRDHGAWVVRGLIGFATLFATSVLLVSKAPLAALSDQFALTRIRPALFALHFAVFAMFAALSRFLYANPGPAFPSDVTAVAWIAAAVLAVFFLTIAVAPWYAWAVFARETRHLIVLSTAASAIACYAGALSYQLWQPATKLTFFLVQSILHSFVGDLVVRPARMQIGTYRFSTIIAPQCSGLEGAALMLVFSLLWLVLCRRQIRFPHALALLPAGIVALFLLNAVRIAALIMIGHAGAREVAIRGFHSQAGWIAFNSVAFGFAVIATRVSWFAKTPVAFAHVDESIDYPAAPYVLPLMAILAAGMISRAMSGVFEWPYSLRFLAALATLWVFRRRYSNVDWSFGWLGPLAGVVVFVLWIGLDRLSGAAQAGSEVPALLAGADPRIRVIWIVFRVLGAIVTVPVAEELALRGFLLRRFIAVDFESVSYRAFTLFSFVASSFIFGLLHGDKWIAGTAAGLLYALASLRKGRLGEAVSAHATTNSLLAIYVLTFHKWNLW
jgi:exosortase E/protease (VPEID-CTERM system)